MADTSVGVPPMRFVDLEAQRKRIGADIDEAIARVLAHGRFIMGPEVEELENALSSMCGARHVVTCASGTDALLLVLLGWNIGPGDAVFVPAFTFAATAGAVALTGAAPVFVDVDRDTFNMDPGSLEAAITATDLRPAAVIPVDLFGLPCDYEGIREAARSNDLPLLGDAAQSFGATVGNRAVGTLADATATSFFPAKPLGAYGDGGAVFTEDDSIAATIRSLRVHGQGAHKYENVRIGMNGRLDTVQAAVLLEKLKIFPEELDARDAAANRYAVALADRITPQHVPPGYRSAWAQFTIRVSERDDVASSMKEVGVPTAVYYPTPLHRQPAYRGFPTSPTGMPVSEELARDVLSLPIHPYLTEDDQQRVIDALIGAVR